MDSYSRTTFYAPSPETLINKWTPATHVITNEATSFCSLAPEAHFSLKRQIGKLLDKILTRSYLVVAAHNQLRYYLIFDIYDCINKAKT